MNTPLPIAVRVYPDLAKPDLDRAEDGSAPQPDAMLVFDCETRTDEAQALTFGSYRFIARGECLEEGLFYGDDLAPPERRVLEHMCVHTVPIRFPMVCRSCGS